MSAEPQQLLHITFAGQDEAWVHGVLIPALGLTAGQYWTRAEDDLGALKLEELERAVQSCRYTLLVASSAARVDQWTQFAGLLAQHLGIEEGKPRLLLVARDFELESERARELLPLRQRCLLCLDCSAPERTAAALATLAAQLALSTTEEVPTECPYPGLRMFGAGDPGSCFNRTDLFFGRDQEGRAIVDQLRDRRRVLLVGPSGCGKSSLVRARVLPVLGQGVDAMTIAIARPGSRPDIALRTALDALDPRLGPVTTAYLASDDKEATWPALVEATSGIAGLLYLDQLEEVFLDTADEHGERAMFFSRLAALGHVPGVAVLLGMRADFYGDLMRSPIWDGFKGHSIELAPLRGAALRQAITRPAEAVGVHVEADLVERLAREADLDRAAEALPLLQVALEQLWAQREWRYLSLASYGRIAEGERRGLDVVLARHADASLQVLPKSRRVMARRVLMDLVHLGEGRPDTRRRRTASELCRAGDDQEDLALVLAQLSARRLITVGADVSAIAAVPVAALVSADGEAEIPGRHVDLAHDTLITGWPTLAGWIASWRDDLRTQRRLEARAAGGGLLTASELPEFAGWVAWTATPAGAIFGASDALRTLVRRSVAARRFRRSLAGVAFAAAVIFATVFRCQNRQLREEKIKVSKAIETAKLIDKLQDGARASPGRGPSSIRSHELLDEIGKVGELDEPERRAAVARKVAYAVSALKRGDQEKARSLYLEILIIDAQQRVAEDPDNTAFQRDLAAAYEKLGDTALASEERSAARTWFVEALALREAVVATSSANTEWQRDLAVTYGRLAAVAKSSDNLHGAQRWYTYAHAVHTKLFQADSTNTKWRNDLASSYGHLGDVAASLGEHVEAQIWYTQAIAAKEALLFVNPANPVWERDLSELYVGFGSAAMASGDLKSAKIWFEQALVVLKALDARDPAVKHDLSVLSDRIAAMDSAAAVHGNRSLATEVKISVSSTTGPVPRWSPEKVVDGYRFSVPSSYGWSSMRADQASQVEWIQLRFPAPRIVTRIDLYPRSAVTDQTEAGDGFPVDFTVELSSDGVGWKFGCGVHSFSKPRTVVTCDIFAQSALLVRVRATRLRQIGPGYYFQLAEIEVH